jgi:2-polyprenyl-3-methyl-5-hydroxy-6-metoxy-1,4-benzoquinol methylase
MSGAFWPPLDRRVIESEDIDDPALDRDRLHGALGGLTTINALSRSAEILWPPIRRLARELKSDRLRVLDIATGAGDVPIRLWRKARRAGLALEIHGIDVSEPVLEYARRRAAKAGAPLAFRRLNVVEGPLPAGYDVITSSLFLHHLSDEAAGKLLRSMAAAAEHLVLVNDLRRSRWGLALAHFAGHVLTRSPVVRLDAVRSVRAALTLGEARELAAEAGLQGIELARHWPCRYLLSWRRRGIQA